MRAKILQLRRTSRQYCQVATSSNTDTDRIDNSAFREGALTANRCIKDSACRHRLVSTRLEVTETAKVPQRDGSSVASHRFGKMVADGLGRRGFVPDHTDRSKVCDASTERYNDRIEGIPRAINAHLREERMQQEKKKMH